MTLATLILGLVTLQRLSELVLARRNTHRLLAAGAVEIAPGHYPTIIAVHTLWLAARAAGLGLGWVSILDPVAVGTALDVPSDWTLVGYFCLGYPQDESDTPELERAGWEHRKALAATLLRR